MFEITYCLTVLSIQIPLGICCDIDTGKTQFPRTEPLWLRKCKTIALHCGYFPRSGESLYAPDARTQVISAKLKLNSVEEQEKTKHNLPRGQVSRMATTLRISVA